MRVLFTTLPLVGHLFPVVPLAWAMQCTGDEVLVATPAEQFAGRITGAGLSAVVIRDVPIAHYAEASVITGSASTLENDLAVSARGWAALAAPSAEEMTRLVREFRPDVVISEPAEFAGRLAAARAGVPWVEQSWGLPFPDGFRGAAQDELTRHGLPALPPPDAVIHPSPRELWPTGAPEGLPMRFVPYNGPVRHERWQSQGPGHRRAFVTFGSLLVAHGGSGQGELFAKVLEELSAAGFEMIVGMDPAQAHVLGPLPPGVLHLGWVPLGYALKECDLAIHHGGSGTTMSSAASGVPQVIMPSATDQFFTSAAMESYGAAIRFMPEQTTPAAVRDAADDVLTDPSYRAAATALAREISSLAAPGAVAENLWMLI